MYSVLLCHIYKAVYHLQPYVLCRPCYDSAGSFGASSEDNDAAEMFHGHDRYRYIADLNRS